MAWNANVEAHAADIAERYGERFLRMWRFYLLSCAGVVPGPPVNSSTSSSSLRAASGAARIPCADGGLRRFCATIAAGGIPCPRPRWSEQTALDALRTVKYPGFSRDIVSFGFVKDLAVGGGKRLVPPRR